MTSTTEDDSLQRSLEGLESLDNYYSWIASLFDTRMNGNVLEVGAGIGTFTKVIAGRATDVDALEPSTQSFLRLKDELKELVHVKPVHGTLEVLASQASGHYDNAVLVNVLEHIEDDLGSLLELKRLLRPGGGLAIWVPAHEFLYSDFDYQIGHFRRYSLVELRQLVIDAGFDVEIVRYHNAPGALAWWVVSKALRREPSNSAFATFWDRTVVKHVAALERHVRFPFGQSLLLLATAPG